MLDKSKVKSLIFHPEKVVRKYAMEFFAEGGIGDIEVTNMLLELYSKGVDDDEALDILSSMPDLPHNEETLSRLWEIEPSDPNIVFHVDRTIVEADLELLKKLPDVRPREQKYIDILEKRFLFASMDTEKLWEKLWEHSQSGLGKGLDEFDYNYGEIIIKELAKRKDFPTDKYLEKIQIDYPEDYDGWDDTYLSVLAGELKSKESIPFLIRTLKIDAAFLCERAVEALVRIGTAEVVEAIGNEYLNEDFHFRIYAAGVLEKIKLKESEELMLKLFPRETDVTLKTHLAYGLSKLFSVDAIPMILTLLWHGYDRQFTNLEESAYVLHVVHGLKHPDMDKWYKGIKEEEEKLKELKKVISKEYLQRIIEEEFEERMAEALGKLIEERKEKERLNKIYSGEVKVGRNDPCPCGSGKKYKKCCGKFVE
ncbi:hypothetical protein JOD02_002060 [Caldicoprobacter guelmensis]|uniref:SEC-C metal-binding domain-containing protein n=1 Tax=Caldicoprobacter guelmensis TaxID=1170224 RepID=UPI001FAF6DC8|nr:SEC-C metal-binding domain-containing protein [Caldicoprobacter guelmensis]MBM7583182.1 hypothetical protein [Caldicoprobacter guelmensis]